MIDDANPYVESNFSWAEWTPNTTLKLCRVPWDASYRDVVRFVSRETQREWFDKLDGVECRPATMHIFGAPVRIDMPLTKHQTIITSSPSTITPNWNRHALGIISSNPWNTLTRTPHSSRLCWTYGKVSSLM